VAAIPNLRGNFAVLFHTHLYEWNGTRDLCTCERSRSRTWISHRDHRFGSCFRASLDQCSLTRKRELPNSFSAFLCRWRLFPFISDTYLLLTELINSDAILRRSINYIFGRCNQYQYIIKNVQLKLSSETPCVYEVGLHLSEKQKYHKTDVVLG
jgi:hypothetical protein